MNYQISPVDLLLLSSVNESKLASSADLATPLETASATAALLHRPLHEICPSPFPT
jgi:hypothetical protein